MTLNNKIVKGGFYLVIANVFSQVISIVVNVFLARLLVPEDFGLMVLATTIIGFILLFTSVGFGSSIIYEKNISQSQISSLYWLNILTSIITFLIVVSCAKYGVKFYNEPRLLYVIWLSSIGILIQTIFTIQYKLKEKKLEFELLSKINVFSALVGSVFAVLAAYIGLGVYALVLQTLISTFIRMLLILSKTDWKPSLTFNFNEIKHMVVYSIKYRLWYKFLHIERNIDYLILGKMFSPTLLGYYSFSYNIMYMPVKKISGVFSDLLFPAFSKIKDNKEKIISGYFKSVNLIAIVSIPSMTILAYNSDFIIPIIFGQQWNNAIPIVKILCFAGAIQSISQFGDIIFSSIGKPEISIYVSFCRTCFTVLAILIGVNYGMLGVAYALVISKALAYLIFLVVLNYVVSFNFDQLLNSLKGPIITFMTISLVYFSHYIDFYNVNSFMLLITMSIITLCLTYVFHKKIIIEFFRILKNKTK